MTGIVTTTRAVRLLTAGVFAAAVVLACPAVGAAKSAPVTGCHATGHVIAHRGGAVIWSVWKRVGYQRFRNRVYVCAPPALGAHIVFTDYGSGGPENVPPHVSSLKLAGKFVAFLLTTGLEGNENLIVFNGMTGRKELTDFDMCQGGHLCYFVPYMSKYALAPDGWVVEVWDLNFYMGPMNVADDLTMIATNDGKHRYSVDFGSRLSALALSGTTLTWTSDLGGASSVTPGPGLIPAASPLPLTGCQLLTATDVAVALGPGASSAGSASQCTYTSASNPAMTLTVSLQTGLSPTQEKASEDALTSAGWDDTMSYAGGFKGFINSVAIAGVTHEKLAAFQNGTEWDLDLTNPGMGAGEQLAWLAHVAYDRLFGIQVGRAQ
jgi:hypothetical protein